MATLSCAGQPTDVTIWDDYECNGGSQIDDFDWLGPSDPITVLDRYHNIETYEHTLEVEFDRFSGSLWDNTVEKNVYRVAFSGGCVLEYRVKDRSQRMETDGSHIAAVECVAPHGDLSDASGIVAQPLVTGERAHSVGQFLTPTQHAEFIFRNSTAASYWSVGQIDATELVIVTYDGFTPLRAFIALKEAVEQRENQPFYLQFLRDAANGFVANLVSDPAPAADVVDIDYAVNMMSLQERVVTEKMATRVFVKSSGEPAEQLNLSDNNFEVESGGQTLTFLQADSPFSEDDQLNGKAIRTQDDTVIGITDTVAPRQVVLASDPGDLSGERVRFVEADGSDLLYLTSPSAEASLPVPVFKVLERSDIPPIVNWADDPFLLNTPATNGWTTFGGASVDHVTGISAEGVSKFGLATYHVTGPPGSGIQSPVFTMPFTARRRWLTAEVALWLISNPVILELHDVSFPDSPDHPFIWFGENANRRARAVQEGVPHEIAVYPGYDFFGRGSSQFQVLIKVDEDAETDGEFHVDAWQLIRKPAPARQIWDGSGANDLWRFARDYIDAFKEAPRFFETEFVDQDRRGFTTGDEVVPGGLGELLHSPMGVFPVQKRIIAATWNYRIEGDTQVELEEIPAHLSDRFLGRARPLIIEQPDENTMKPPCPRVKYFRVRDGDFEGRWHKDPGQSGFELRVLDTEQETPRDQWEHGVHLTFVHGASWILKAGEESEGEPPFSPSDLVDEKVGIEAYNDWGVPSECFEAHEVLPFELEAPCVNVMGADGVDSRCSTGAGAGEVLVHTYEDVPVGRLDGATRISYCYDGSTQFGAEDPDPTEARSVRMVQAVVLSDLNGQHWIGPMVHSSSGGGSHDDRLAAPISIQHNTGTDRIILQEWVDDEFVVLNEADVPDKVGSTRYRVSIAADGLDVAGYDFDSDTLIEATASTRASGFGGVGANDTDFMHTYEYYDCAGRELTVAGLSSGQKAQVLDDADAVLGEATESGGTASVDMLSVDLEAAAAVVVVDSGGTEQARFTPGGGQKQIAGGDGYSFSGGAIGRHTTGLIAHHVAGSSAPFNLDHWERGLHCTLPDLMADGSLRTHAFQVSQWYGIRYAGGDGGGDAEAGEVLAALDLELLDEAENVLAAYVDPGVQTSALDDFERGIGAQGLQVPDGTATLRFKAKKKGADPGDICIRRIQLNIGGSCCQFATPGTPPLADAEELLDFDSFTASVDCEATPPLDLSLGVTWSVAQKVLEASEGVYQVRLVIHQATEGEFGTIEIHDEVYAPDDSPLTIDLSDHFDDASEADSSTLLATVSLLYLGQSQHSETLEREVSCGQDFTNSIHILQVGAAVADCASGGGLDLTIDLSVDALILADTDRFDFRVTVWEVPAPDGVALGGQVYQQIHEVDEQIIVNLPDRYSDATNAASHTLDVGVVLLDQGSSVDSDAESTTATYGDTCP